VTEKRRRDGGENELPRKSSSKPKRLLKDREKKCRNEIFLLTVHGNQSGKKKDRKNLMRKYGNPSLVD